MTIRNTGGSNVEEYVYVDLMEDMAILAVFVNMLFRAKAKRRSRSRTLFEHTMGCGMPVPLEES